mmetsp:Transcript_10447/g.22510  ORF Transcript_10447/g.22510 Transcript_10447/m.22510 type:complete len:474 (+) Transcript_10447:281-1702(+)
MQKTVGTIPLHTHDTQIPPKVPGITPTDRQSIPQTRQRRIDAVIDIFVERHHPLLNLRIGRGEEIGPNPLHVAAGDAAAFVGDFDDDVFVVGSVGDDDFDGGVVGVDSVVFDSGSHGVFEEFEHDVVEVGWYVGEGHIQPPRDDNFRSIPILPRTHKRRIVNGPLDNLIRTRPTANDPHVTLHGRLPQTQILPDQDPNPNPRNIKPIQKGVRALHEFELHGIPPGLQFPLFHRRQLGPLALAAVVISREERPLPNRRAEFEGPPRHLDQDAPVSLVDVLQDPGEVPFFVEGGDDLGGGGEDFEEGGGVEVLDLLDGGHLGEEGDAGEVLDAVGEADGEFVAEEAGYLEEDEGGGFRGVVVGVVVVAVGGVAVGAVGVVAFLVVAGQDPVGHFVQEFAAAGLHERLEGGRRLGLYGVFVDQFLDFGGRVREGAVVDRGGRGRRRRGRGRRRGRARLRCGRHESFALQWTRLCFH